ncbi:imm11 family protein [Sulfitobacter mediterraneus]|uniref:imm11 family protein n=2 Tax=Sulfitobacter mediterraneus TaxID=83219 RepID=UPI00193929A8|nr:DUF1629 domain-containing protein [Sulfitobacter mediterraneus]MBM1595569.1 hypothetical protein [Sulfitobacter mediterraneus]MBM1603245.1 hypothetical protein [Sulfitobacter mediterraneus]MBM1614597.1 hypothetical protein [Sulfitobacter mediterraneus]MBM1618457.1 hypothetical protein [Sulfitobacter mediterraneus]MBM1625991.1 hypothetical protein [Sulfitobacter mediterraneus]
MSALLALTEHFLRNSLVEGKLRKRRFLMTWILAHQRHFGPYFLDGTITDLEGKMKAEFDRVATDEMKENFDSAFYDFRYSNSVKYTHPAARAEDFQKPSRLQLNRPQKDLADILQVQDGLTVVSKPVMDIIQAAAPDTVQFWPFEILTRRGQLASDKAFFAMMVLKPCNAFRPDLSVEGSTREGSSGSGKWHIHQEKKAFLTGLVIEIAKTGGAPIWYEERIYQNPIFFADELGQQLQGGEFKLPPKFYQCVTA